MTNNNTKIKKERVYKKLGERYVESDDGVEVGLQGHERLRYAINHGEKCASLNIWCEKPDSGTQPIYISILRGLTDWVKQGVRVTDDEIEEMKQHLIEAFTFLGREIVIQVKDSIEVEKTVVRKDNDGFKIEVSSIKTKPSYKKVGENAVRTDDHVEVSLGGNELLRYEIVSVGGRESAYVKAWREKPNDETQPLNILIHKGSTNWTKEKVPLSNREIEIMKQHFIGAFRFLNKEIVIEVKNVLEDEVFTLKNKEYIKN
jgi:hypothetical protein